MTQSKDTRFTPRGDISDKSFGRSLIDLHESFLMSTRISSLLLAIQQHGLSPDVQLSQGSEELLAIQRTLSETLKSLQRTTQLLCFGSGNTDLQLSQTLSKLNESLPTPTFEGQSERYGSNPPSKTSTNFIRDTSNLLVLFRSILKQADDTLVVLASLHPNQLRSLFLSTTHEDLEALIGQLHRWRSMHGTTFDRYWVINELEKYFKTGSMTLPFYGEP